MKQRLNKRIRGEQVVDYIKRYQKLNKYSPTYREIAEYLNLSIPEIQNIVKYLKDENILSMSEDRNRKFIINK